MNARFPAAHWDLDDRINVVLFAGMGGGCDGVEDAGFPVHLAINHDRLAIAVHKVRHPHTRHLLSDVFEVDPRKAVGRKRVGILHASPDCTHFSVAKGSKPVSRRRRSLAWVIVRWAGTVRPELITMENVREIVTWGPLIAKRDPKTGRVMRLDGSVAAKGERVPVQEQWLTPDPRHKGRIWRAWKRHLLRLGYSFDHRVLCCADYGIPTIRTRFFGVAQADRGSIGWMAATHARRDRAKALRLKPWVGADTFVDFTKPTKSIFERERPLAEATLRRIARGIMRYVVNAPRPFIVPITHAGDLRVHDTADPSRTWTTAHRGEMSLVVPVVAGVGGRMGQSAERSGEDPLQSNTTKPDSVVVASHLQKYRTDASGADMREPMPAYTANSFHKRPGGAPPLGVAAVHMEKFNQNGEGTMPVEPLGAVMAGAPRHAVVAATLVQTGYGEREGQSPRALDVQEPIGAQVAGGGKAALVAAFLAQHNTGVVGHEAREPLSTLTMGGDRGASQQAVVAATLGSLRGTDKDGQDIRDPLPAQSAGGHHEMLILPFLQAYYQSGSEGARADDPLRALTERARHGLVTVEVDGVTMVITDIRMRMLDPLEGAMAHEFDPSSLQQEIEIIDRKGRTIRRKPTKTEVGHLVGNSVPWRMISLLVKANVRRRLASAPRAP